MTLWVIIPAKGERFGIGKTIQSMFEPGTAPKNTFVIDDASSDGTG
jgi:hypothetical protein